MLASALVFHHHLGGSRNQSGEKELQEKPPQLHVNNAFEMDPTESKGVLKGPSGWEPSSS